MLRAARLKEELSSLLAAEPGDVRALDGAVAAGASDGLAQAEPALRPLLRLARARSLLLQSRFDEARNTLLDVKGVLDGVSSRDAKRMTAEVRYRLAEMEDVRSTPVSSCGPLGLKRLAAFEGRTARERVERLAKAYGAVVKVGERFWSRRAAYRTAVLYDEFYRSAIAATMDLRAVALPSPFSVGRVDAGLVVGEVLSGTWPGEISRLYSEVIASIDVREPDPVLVSLVSSRAAAFARLAVPSGERAENPWLVDEKPGLVRFNKRFERKSHGRTWTAVQVDEGQGVFAAALAAGPGTVQHAYAVAARAEAGPPLPAAELAAALQHADPRVVLAGLFAAEKQPSSAFLERLLEVAVAPAPQEPFQTLQGALFGTRERALLALRALAHKDRDAAEKILADVRLAPRERAWVVAELNEPRLQPALSALSRDRDPIVAATALYALFSAGGKGALGAVRPQEAGVVGCVSRAIIAFE